MDQVLIVTTFGMGGLILLGNLLLIAKCYYRVPQGSVLIRNGVGGARVSFTAMVALPLVHHLEMMDITVKRIQLELTDSGGISFQDGTRLPLTLEFFLQVANDPEAILRVAQSVGCVRASSETELSGLLSGKFTEAVKAVAREFPVAGLPREAGKFKEMIVAAVGTDLLGFTLTGLTLDFQDAAE